MCVDDDQILLKSIADDPCVREAFDFYACSDARRAVADIMAVEPDIVFLDIMMPGGGGFEVLKALRDAPQTRCIPVVMLTAVSSFEARVNSLRMYSEGYLEKPCTPMQIVEKAKETLRARQNADKMIFREG
jgi:two-component system cell cycle response regulator